MDKILAFIYIQCVNVAHAANGTSVGVPFPDSKKTSYATWGEYLTDFYRFALNIGLALAILMIVYSSILYATSQGEQQKINTAKEFTMGAIIGLILLYMINVIAKFLGIVPLPTT